MTYRFVANRPIIAIDLERLEREGVPSDDVRSYLPEYILNPKPLYYGVIKQVWFAVVQWSLKLLVKILLRPRKTPVGDLDVSEVNRIYTKEAGTYNRKHHLTTNGMDLVWRRMAGQFVATIGHHTAGPIKVLDLCTGTGLVIKEMIPILKDWNIDAEIIGLDYNKEMLAIARDEVIAGNIQFVHGDAMNLVTDKESGNLLTTFDFDSIDVVTQIFGIGGIPEPLRVFEGILQILKPGGEFFMIDMHKPVPERPGEWPFLSRWFRFPIFEMIVYEKSTVPLVLNRLWGWRDTTLCFYLLPLVTHRDITGRYWGFQVQSFEQGSQRWWFNLPLMPIAKIVVKKIEISEKVAKTRRTILEACALAPV